MPGDMEVSTEDLHKSPPNFSFTDSLDTPKTRKLLQNQSYNTFNTFNYFNSTVTAIVAGSQPPPGSATSEPSFCESLYKTCLARCASQRTCPGMCMQAFTEKHITVYKITWPGHMFVHRTPTAEPHTLHSPTYKSLNRHASIVYISHFVSGLL